jgi:uncharacterized membrane protein YgcG
MKRSAQVTAPLLAAAALSLLTACRRSPEMQRCVDENNHVVDPSFCKNQPAAANGVHPGGGYFPIYRYYYGGGGGSATSGTARGGFGSTFGGGDAGGGGE